MNDNDELRAAMWDLVYDLLSSDESKTLIAQIKSDPHAARLYAEVRLQADLVTSAARVEDESVVLNRDTAASESRVTARERKLAATAGTLQEEGRVGAGSAGRWLMGVAATALAALLAVGFLWPEPDLRLIATRFVATDIEVPPSMPAGLTNTVTLRTYYVNHEGEPAAAPTTVDVRLRRRGGEELFYKQVATDERGRGSVEVPGSALEPGVQLEMNPLQKDSRQWDDGWRAAVSVSDRESSSELALNAELPVQEEPQMAYFFSEEPGITAGKATKFGLWNFMAFSNKPAPAEGQQLAVQNLAEQAQAQPDFVTDRDSGVVSGTLESPQASALGAAPLSVQNSSGYTVNSGDRLAGIKSQLPSQNRFAGRQQQAAEPSAQSAAQSEARPPVSARALALQSAPLGEQKEISQLQRTGGESSVSMIAAGRSIEIEIPADLADKQLLAVANCRGVTVASELVGAEKSTADGNLAKSPAQRLQLDLPAEADGLIEVGLYDQSSAPPQLVQQKFVYREPARKLNIEVPEVQQRFAPGQRVQLKLQVTDENRQPAAGAQVSVRMWNEVAVRQAPEQALLLADAVREGAAGPVVNAAPQSGISNLAQLTPPTVAPGRPEQARVEFNRAELKDALTVEKLAQQKKADAPAEAKATPAATDDFRTAGGAGALGFGANKSVAQAESELAYGVVGEVASSEPIPLATNRPAVQAEYEAAVSQARQRRQAAVRTIGGVALAGGAALVALLCWLALVRMLTSPRLAASALAVAAASLLVGLSWVGWMPSGGVRTAMALPQAAEEASPSQTAAPIAETELLERTKAAAGSTSTPLATNGSVAAAGGEPANKPADDSAARPDGAALAVAPPAGPAAPAVDSLGRERQLVERLKESAESLPAAGVPLVAGGMGAAGRANAAAPGAGKAGQDQRTLERFAAPQRGAVPADEAGARRELAAVKDLERAASDGKAQAPTSLYFNPHLVADKSGQVTIEFVMPPVESEYRLLIDALGHGRIGSRQEMIVGKKDESK